MAERITVKLCSKKMAYEAISDSIPNDKIQVSVDSVPSSIWPNTEIITASVIVPIKHESEAGINDCESQDKVIQVPLMKDNMSDEEIINCLWGIGELTWERGCYESIFGEVYALHEFLTITWTNPQDNCAGCFWYASTVAGKSPESIVPRYPFIVSTSRVSIPGEIPNDNSSAWMADVASSDSTQDKPPGIAPGEQMVLLWAMNVNERVIEAPMALTWFSTPLITGGTILGVVDQDTVNQIWTVSVEGTTVEVIPTDFAQYEVGSWVYLLKQEGPAAVYDRKSVYTYELQSGRCVPLEFSGASHVSGTLQTKDYNLSSDFSKGFELSYLLGVITDIDVEANTADIDLTITTPDTSYIQNFTSIPIFYHCQESTDVSDGAKAFKVNDTVLVLNEDTGGGAITPLDLSIIGFPGKLQLCARHHLFITLDDYCIILDLPTLIVSRAVTLNTGQSAVFPVKTLDISDWLLLYAEGGSSPLMATSLDNPDSPVWPSECTTSYVTDLQQEVNPVRICVERYDGANCSTDQTVNGVTKQAWSVYDHYNWESSEEESFLYDNTGESYFPFGRDGADDKDTKFVIGSISVNVPLSVYGENELNVDYSHQDEMRFGNLIFHPDLVFPCTCVDWAGTKTDDITNSEYTFSSPFGQEITFTLTDESHLEGINTVGGSSFDLEVNNAYISENSRLAGGVVGNEENNIPYMVSWVYWKVTTGLITGTCSTSTPAPVFTPCGITTWSEPTITEQIDDFRVFYNDTPGGDPKDLDPFNLPPSQSIKDAMQTLCGGSVTYVKLSAIEMSILY